jgi:response regulator RpfG family c-di-GMP phosphodiesterase
MTTTRPERPDGPILLIDDEPNLLQGIRRQLHKRFDLVLAGSGAEAMALLQARGPFAVVVSDMNMPGQSGIEVLARIAEASPDTVRIMLTGQADLGTAVEAVNHGNIFRFFTTPCAIETLAAGLEAGLKQYRLVTAERELLQKTLAGSIKVLTDVLAMTDPEGFGRTEQTRRWCRSIAPAIGMKRQLWKLEMAAMLAPIGPAALPPEVAVKARGQRPLTAVEQEMVEATAETAHKLICNIPRLADVAAFVLYQNKNVDGSGFPRDEKAGAAIPQGARVLRILNDLAQGRDHGTDLRDLLGQMAKQSGSYDQELLAKIAAVLVEEAAAAPSRPALRIEVQIGALQPGDVLQSPILDLEHDDLILAAGATITELYIKRLTNLRRVRKLTPTALVQRAGSAEPDRASA